jgi:hypothetical protein
MYETMHPTRMHQLVERGAVHALGSLKGDVAAAVGAASCLRHVVGTQLSLAQVEARLSGLPDTDPATHVVPGIVFAQAKIALGNTTRHSETTHRVITEAQRCFLLAATEGN